MQILGTTPLNLQENIKAFKEIEANDLKALEENSKQKLILVENTYKGSLFKADIKNKTLNKDKLKIIKANN